MKKEIYIDIVSCVYAMLFLYTGISKISDQELFRNTLYKSPLLKPIASAITICIPLLEILIALTLLFPFFRHSPWPRKWGLSAGAALMAIFTIYVGYMLKFAHGLPCSCGGIIQKMNWHQHFYFNSCITLLGFLAIWLNNRQSNMKKTTLAFS
jgi:uncharacterized membrane protein YphA (DoxX/SURF4 family)